MKMSILNISERAATIRSSVLTSRRRPLTSRSRPLTSRSVDHRATTRRTLTSRGGSDDRGYVRHMDWATRASIRREHIRRASLHRYNCQPCREAATTAADTDTNQIRTSAGQRGNGPTTLRRRPLPAAGIADRRLRLGTTDTQRHTQPGLTSLGDACCYGSITALAVCHDPASALRHTTRRRVVRQLASFPSGKRGVLRCSAFVLVSTPRPAQACPEPARSWLLRVRVGSASCPAPARRWEAGSPPTGGPAVLPVSRGWGRGDQRWRLCPQLLF